MHPRKHEQYITFKKPRRSPRKFKPTPKSEPKHGERDRQVRGETRQYEASNIAPRQNGVKRAA